MTWYEIVQAPEWFTPDLIGSLGTKSMLKREIWEQVADHSTGQLKTVKVGIDYLGMHTDGFIDAIRLLGDSDDPVGDLRKLALLFKQHGE